MKSLRYQIWFLGGAGTYPERYLCAEFQTVDAAEGYIQHYGFYGAEFEIIDTQNFADQ